MTGVVKSVGKYALLAGTALALSMSAASAASMAKAGMDKRVADLEREVTLLKNQMKQTMMAKPSKAGLVSGSSTVKVSLYGRLNPAIRFASNQSESSVQALDNSHSSSRFGINAVGAMNKKVTASALIEVGVNGPNRPGSGFDISAGAPAVDLRIAQGSISHADMGTLTIGHGWRAGSGGFGANFVGTGVVFGIWGPGGDALPATVDGATVGKRHGAGPIYAFGAREARIHYSTPNLMGVGLEASYNQDKGWSAGASFSGFPNMKEVSIALNSAYHSNGENGESTGFGVSGSVKHNSSGVIATGIYGEQDDNTAWMVEGGWTGKINDAGNTSVTIGYGEWGDGVSSSTRYHFAVLQSIASAGTDVYFGVSFDTGDATHTVDSTGDGTTYEIDAMGAIGKVDDTAMFDETCNVGGVQADDMTTCAVERDGVMTIIAGVLIKF